MFRLILVIATSYFMCRWYATDAKVILILCRWYATDAKVILKVGLHFDTLLDVEVGTVNSRKSFSEK
jgi:hypothetical protein